MRKLTVSPIPLAVPTGMTLVLASALIGCVAMPTEPIGPAASVSRAPERSPQPTVGSTSDLASPTDFEPTAEPTELGPTAEPITADACLLRRQPGPDDVAPRHGDLTDWSHISGGRVRLCLDGFHRGEVEGRASCRWTDPFDAVSDVYGFPITFDAETGRLGGSLSLQRGVVSVGLDAPDGLVSSWEGGPAGQQIRSHDHGRRGIARFDVSPVLDPEHPPAVVPPNLVGLLRWACLEPPST